MQHMRRLLRRLFMVLRHGRPQVARRRRERAGEPEDAPYRREQAFLEERITALAPKEPPSPAAGPPQRPGQPPEASPVSLPPDFHRRLVQEYRRRQLAQPLPTPTTEPSRGNGGPSGAPAPPESGGGGGGPGEALPPPANNWIPIGPSVVRRGQLGGNLAVSGRARGIAVAPGGKQIYIGAANGGVWRSDDTGQTWRSLMDAFDLDPIPMAPNSAADSLAVGALAIDLTNPDRVYVGSGEGGAAFYFGVGPIVTNNGTTNRPTWTTESAAPGSPPLAGTVFYALAVDPVTPDRVVAATYRGVYRREPTGIIGGGYQWVQKRLDGIGSQSVTSVVVAASGGTTTYYAARLGGLDGSTAFSAGVFSSSDGDTWNAVGTGFPTAAVGRIGLAVQPDNPQVVYALVARSDNGLLHGVYRLDTSVGTWREIVGAPLDLFGTSWGQGWYDLAIAIAPDNINRIYLGGSIGPVGTTGGGLYRCEVSVSGGPQVRMRWDWIGFSVHADIHTLVFAPGDANKLWVGCDGGVFYSTDPTIAGALFVARNTGLQTLQMTNLGQHPTEDAVLFCGTQDNGGVRFTGEEAWLHFIGGDSIHHVVNWMNPYTILSQFGGGEIFRSTDGGKPYTDLTLPWVGVPLAAGDAALGIAPLVGTPPKPSSPTAAADANLVAFGSIRPWLSTTFGGGWQSIPDNNLAGDSLNGPIRSLVFASPTKLYAGTTAGGVYRFEKGAATWRRTQINTVGGANALTLAGSVSGIAVDPADATGNAIYLTLGGWGDYRHVWHFDGARWQHRSGPTAGSLQSLLDVQANAIVADPANPTHLYVGADLGVWRSTDGGATWAAFSQGLPDAAVMDLALHHPRRLLRAATHGRGVYERTLSDAPPARVELYIRNTQLDQGRFFAMNGLPDPTAPGERAWFWLSPDIKLDTPDATGQYQFPLTGTTSDGSIDFLQFVDSLTDDFQNVATYDATATITTRVYVQVHNRGVTQANNVRVMLLLAKASAGLPPLPAGFETHVRDGSPITTADWRTVGFATLHDVRVGFPKIAAFNLPSDMLPLPASLAGSQHQCVLALVHHADDPFEIDPFTYTETNADMRSVFDRKVAHKNLTVVQFTGTLPPSGGPAVVPVDIHNASADESLLMSLVIRLNDYPGRVRLWIPQVQTEGDLKGNAQGMSLTRDVSAMRRWARGYLQRVERNQKAPQPSDRLWSQQRIAAIRQALATGTALTVESKQHAALHRLVLDPGSSHTVYLVFDRPPGRKAGRAYEVEVEQVDARRQAVIGGLRVRVERVPSPRRRARGLRAGLASRPEQLRRTGRR